MSQNPLCFLDVDGVINACPPLPEGEHERIFEAKGFTICYPNGLVENVRRLAKHFEMVWLTTWEHDANVEYVHHFSDGDMWPVVEWRAQGYQNKLQAAHRWMIDNGHESTPFVQIDDDSYWEQSQLRSIGWDMDEHFPQKNLLIVPECHRGLTDEHVDTAISWKECVLGA